MYWNIYLTTGSRLGTVNIFSVKLSQLIQHYFKIEFCCSVSHQQDFKISYAAFQVESLLIFQSTYIPFTLTRANKRVIYKILQDWIIINYFYIMFADCINLYANTFIYNKNILHIYLIYTFIVCMSYIC